MYEGKVFSIPGSGLCVKGPSSTPRFSMWSKSFAYRFRFFLPTIPVPAPEGSHSFLIQSAHLCRSKNKNINNHYTFSEQIRHIEKTEAITGLHYVDASLLSKSLMQNQPKSLKRPNQKKKMVKYRD